MLKRELIIQWIDKAIDTETGTKLFIPTESKDNAMKLIHAFRKELDTLYRVDADKAGCIIVSRRVKDMRNWVVLERTAGSSLIGFIRNPDGTTHKVSIEGDIEKERRIALMRQDGFTEEQIREMEGD